MVGTSLKIRAQICIDNTARRITCIDHEPLHMVSDCSFFSVINGLLVVFSLIYSGAVEFVIYI